MNSSLVIVIGAYGSGKSEYAINLSTDMKINKADVSLVDLDIVNPYFRSRDMREKFIARGIDVIAPEGHFKHADLPMLSPRISGEVQNEKKGVILDVGGDPAGCRALARYTAAIKKRGYEMHYVVNTKRPFTTDEKEVSGMLEMLNQASKLEITHLVCNTNLMEYTDRKIVEEGIGILDAVAKKHDLIFDTYTVLEDYKDQVPDGIAGKQRRIIKQFLQKPWQLDPGMGI